MATAKKAAPRSAPVKQQQRRRRPRAATVGRRSSRHPPRRRRGAAKPAKKAATPADGAGRSRACPRTASPTPRTSTSSSSTSAEGAAADGEAVAHRPGRASRGRGQLADRGRRDGRRPVRRRGWRGRHDGRRARARPGAVGPGPPDRSPTSTPRWAAWPTGTYGYSIESGRPIPRERLEAIPWATVLVEEKVGGIGRR